jgi:hypothetical protein
LLLGIEKMEVIWHALGVLLDRILGRRETRHLRHDAEEFVGSTGE